MKKKALVGIVMGSESDLQVMGDAAEILNFFKVPNEVKVVSAHRTTEKMVQYAKQAEKRGIKVIIAGAGGAAHLPGMIASITPVPVIGVPVRTSSLGGLDSLMSIVQMPPGVPVATVAINGAKNAGILACQILAASDPKAAKKIQQYKKNLEKNVLEKAGRLDKVGYKKYLKTLASQKK